MEWIPIKENTKIIVLNDFKNILVEGNPPQSWPSRQNGTTVTVSMIIFKMCHLKIFWKKLHFEPKSPSITGKVCCYYNSWVTGICMAYKL